MQLNRRSGSGPKCAIERHMRGTFQTLLILILAWCSSSFAQDDRAGGAPTTAAAGSSGDSTTLSPDESKKAGDEVLKVIGHCAAGAWGMPANLAKGAIAAGSSALNVPSNLNEVLQNERDAQKFYDQCAKLDECKAKLLEDINGGRQYAGEEATLKKATNGNSLRLVLNGVTRRRAFEKMQDRKLPSSADPATPQGNQGRSAAQAIAMVLANGGTQVKKFFNRDSKVVGHETCKGVANLFGAGATHVAKFLGASAMPIRAMQTVKSSGSAGNLIQSASSLP